MPQILVVDDEIGIRELLSEILSDEGYTVLLAENAASARRIRGERTLDLVLLDIWMPEIDGISLLKEWSSSGLLTMPVVMMSGHGTIDTAVEATRIGAAGFLEKPIALQKLLATVRDALKHKLSSGKQPPALEDFERSTLLKDFRKRLVQALAKNRALLIRNAAGGIVEVGARALRTPRTPWIDLSNSSAPLTQAVLEDAAGGILFVPDLVALNKSQQKNLAFVLDRLEKYRLKLIVASAAPRAAPDGADGVPALRALLSDTAISLPPLAECADEIPLIAAFLLSHLVGRDEVPARRFSDGALDALRSHSWGSEWAELLAVVKETAFFALEEDITASDAESVLRREAKRPQAEEALFVQPLRDAREAFERLYFEHHLKNEAGNMARVAEKTGLERTHLYRKLKQLGLSYGRRGEEGAD
ncbi:MAG: response regulator [Candidatus Accumulibacter sp.]|jgi:DNA-binding NtrC family response regulator|nr:response regulator [Accumulibacter sp.]